MKSISKKKQVKSKKGGRPLFDGKSKKLVLSKLNAAWDIGATDEEACAHGGISVPALHRYFDKNPEFREERNRRKLNPVLKARKTVYKNLDKIHVAKWYLERKNKKEFVKPSSKPIQDKANSNPLTLADALKALHSK